MPVSYKNKEELDGEVLFVMNQHMGEDNAILRWDLVVRIFGMDAVTDETRNDSNPFDRAVRNSLERLRKQEGHLICNRGNGSGYYTARSREEYKQFKQYFLGANYEKFITVAKMDEKADEKWGPEPKKQPVGQVSMFEVA